MGAIQKIKLEESSHIGTPRAIIPVHLYGHPADMQAIMAIADEFGLDVIEDCAQAHGAMIGDKKVGTFGKMAAFSFYPTKNLGAFGDGGALITNEKMLFEKANAIRQYGWEERYISSYKGINSRLDELQAAVLNVKLKNLDDDNSKRRTIASTYYNRLNDKELVTPFEKNGVYHVYHQFVVRHPRRDSLMKHLKDYNIATAIHYPLPVHMQKAYNGSINCFPDKLHVTEKICREIVSLPMYPQITDEQMEYIFSSLSMWS
jgi:dTDP-4-amino-4,6-dideoxygalactose transaminase